MIEAGDPDRASRDSLRRHKLWAGGLLLLAAVALIAVRLWLPEGFAKGLAIAALEASLVGGLADWFAVTALFRRPLGLPIPHTAIVPRAKTRIAQGLGRFIATHFLDAKVLEARLARLDMAGALARWLSKPAVGEGLGTRLAMGLPVLLRSIEDQDLRAFLGDALALRASKVDLSAFLARLLRGLYDSGDHGPVIVALSRFAREALERSDDAIKAEIALRSSWWMPKFLDDRIAQSVVGAIGEILEEIERPTSATRGQIEAAWRALAERLDDDPITRDEVEAWKLRVLDQPQARAITHQAWDAVKAMLGGQDPQAALRWGPLFAQAIQSLGQALSQDPAMARRLDRRLKTIVLQALVPARQAIGGFVTDVVEAWDASSLSQRLELNLGADLQYIRISGTLVGALAGAALFLLGQGLARVFGV